MNPDWVYAPKKGKTLNMSGYSNSTEKGKDVPTTDFKRLWRVGDAAAGVCSFCREHGPTGWYCCGNHVFATRMMPKPLRRRRRCLN